MQTQTLSRTDRDLIRLVHEPGFDRWREQIKQIGGCAHPVYLAGSSTTFDTVSGEVLTHYDTHEEPTGRLAVRCGNRRKSRCPPCSWLHSGDTYQLIRAGLSGGKGVTSAVSYRPRVFLTLTAPSFGPVHRATNGPCRPRRDGGLCDHGIPVSCTKEHDESDPLVGQPVCAACYDYTGHVLWHACAGRLWNRWCGAVRRHLARAGGITQARLRDHLIVSFAKVAEYQRRGAVHVHAVIRLDGPDGPASPPPTWATTELLISALRSAAAAVEVTAPHSAAVGEYRVSWGPQIDAHAIQADTAGADGHGLSDDAVASYVAKYTSKSVSESGIDYRIREYAEIRHAPVSPHIRALMSTAWRLGGLKEYADLNLRLWAHTLGYRGHILTKSRRYSTTYGNLRSARTRHKLPAPPGAIKQASWRYVGSGHTTAESWIAAGIAEDVSQIRGIKRELLYSESLHGD
ncbi:replication initiator [Streptomyces sp. SCSIO ZS0520]|uniref:replication initiator n=1 Tax=Streptomyces sp. SCSIO ZS0520 TaxID=2892996 RepID=UPI0021D960EE|nr:replication initiator [Streptomyces sp. SCSIO ZS0520]